MTRPERARPTRWGTGVQADARGGRRTRPPGEDALALWGTIERGTGRVYLEPSVTLAKKTTISPAESQNTPTACGWIESTGRDQQITRSASSNCAPIDASSFS